MINILKCKVSQLLLSYTKNVQFKINGHIYRQAWIFCHIILF